MNFPQVPTTLHHGNRRERPFAKTVKRRNLETSQRCASYRISQYIISYCNSSRCRPQRCIASVSPVKSTQRGPCHSAVPQAPLQASAKSDLSGKSPLLGTPNLKESSRSCETHGIKGRTYMICKYYIIYYDIEFYLQSSSIRNLQANHQSKSWLHCSNTKRPSRL